jgi:hypothetical protein
MNKEAYELGVQLALRDAGLVKEAGIDKLAMGRFMKYLKEYGTHPDVSQSMLKALQGKVDPLTQPLSNRISKIMEKHWGNRGLLGQTKQTRIGEALRPAQLDALLANKPMTYKDLVQHLPAREELATSIRRGWELGL